MKTMHKKTMHKKSQLTAFVLVAFVMVILVVLLTVLYISIANVSISNKQFVNDKVDEVKTYINDCITNGLILGLKTVGIDKINEYMKSLSCIEFVGQIKDASLNSNSDNIDARLKDEQIDVDYYADISVKKGNSNSEIDKLSYSYNLYNILGIDENNDNKADLDFSIGTIGNIGVLLILQGTSIDNDNIAIEIKPADNPSQLSDTIAIRPDNKFNPFPALRIIYPNCIDKETAIINKKSFAGIETSCLSLDNDIYAISEIKESSEYFVGSCDNFRCCWNGNCNANTGESCSNCAGDCGECSAAPIGSGGDQPSDQQQEQPPEDLPPEQGFGGW